MNQPRKHHWVPQYYLEGFTNSQGQLHVYDKLGQTSYRNSPQDAAAGRDFHAWEASVFQPSDPMYIEKLLGTDFEGRHASVLKQVLEKVNSRSKGWLSDSTKGTLAEMVALQLIRTPRIRAQMEELGAREAQSPGVTMSGDELAKHAHLSMLDPGLSGILKNLTQHLAQRRCRFFHVPEGGFWTADVPVITALHDPATGKISLSASQGVGRDGAEVYFPLSSSLVLVLFADHVDVPDGQLQIMTSAYVEQFNRMMFIAADQRIYGKDPILPPLDQEDQKV